MPRYTKVAHKKASKPKVSTSTVKSALIKSLPKKWLDTDWYRITPTAGISIGNSTAISSTGPWFNLTAIAEGTDRINRVGRKVRITGIHIKMVVEAAKENLLFGGDLNNIIRLVLYKIKTVDPFTSGGNLTSYLYPVGDAVTALPDRDDVTKVYLDKTFLVQTQYGVTSSNPNTNGATQTQYQAAFEKYIPMNHVAYYNNTGAANVSNPQIILGLLSDSTVAPHPSATCSFRIYFEDLI